MIDNKPFMVTNEQAKELLKSDTVTIMSIADIRMLSADLIDSRELIDKQESLIKEMRKSVGVVYSHACDEDRDCACEMCIGTVDALSDILEKTKDYA